jgi:predicted RNase H-like HicB family nuclease
MKRTYSAVIEQQSDAWIGWIEEVPGVNCQAATRAELLETLRTTLAEALEFDRREARGAAGQGCEELEIAVCDAATRSPGSRAAAGPRCQAAPDVGA